MQADAFADVVAGVVAGAIKSAVAPLVARLAVLEADTPRTDEALHDLKAGHLDVMTRLATLEARPPVPGPAGPPGPPGRDGLNGKDGAPGLTYCGVYVDGKSYERGDVVTWAGSTWHCHDTTTTRPGEGSKSWQLMVKRGRDGKDAHGPA